MTTYASSPTAIALRRAAVRATTAPSVHNTQPWHFTLGADGMSLYADRARQLPVLDPTSRQLTISCGCALLNARASLAADGFEAIIDRTPDIRDSQLLAVITAKESGTVDVDLAALDGEIDRRHTNRRRFDDEPVPEDVLDALEEAVHAEDARLIVIHDVDQRLMVTRLAQHADEIQNLNPSYRAEVRAWTTDDPGRLDGVPSTVIPRVTALTHDDVPIRNFDMHASGALPTDTHSSRKQTLVLLCTEGDRQHDWLRAGEGLERALLEITKHGYAASPLTQITEVPSTREALRAELGIDDFPHVLLRVGRAPATPGTRRRRLVDVLVEEI
ncbi:MAG TPA: nitroreductase family protein [Jatrophihabitans sp.]